MGRLVWTGSRSARRVVQLTWYAPEAFERTKVAYAQHCDVHVKALSAHTWQVDVQATEVSAVPFPELVLEFWNYWLDQTCEQYLNSPEHVL